MFINAPPPHPKYKGKNLLKMYMIWNKNETKEISENYGRKYENILPCRNEGADDGEINFPNKWITHSKLDGEMDVMCIHGKRGLQL